MCDDHHDANDQISSTRRDQMHPRLQTLAARVLSPDGRGAIHGDGRFSNAQPVCPSVVEVPNEVVDYLLDEAYTQVPHAMRCANRRLLRACGIVLADAADTVEYLEDALQQKRALPELRLYALRGHALHPPHPPHRRPPFLLSFFTAPLAALLAASLLDPALRWLDRTGRCLLADGVQTRRLRWLRMMQEGGRDADAWWHAFVEAPALRRLARSRRFRLWRERVRGGGSLRGTRRVKADVADVTVRAGRKRARVYAFPSE